MCVEVRRRGAGNVARLGGTYAGWLTLRQRDLQREDGWKIKKRGPPPSVSARGVRERRSMN